MSARDRSRIERISRPWKLDIMSHIRRFNLKDTRAADREPERPSVFGPRRVHGFESLRPNWVTCEGKITIPPSASMYRFQSVVFFCACFARSTAIVATTFLTTSSTSTPRISRNKYFIRSRSMCPRPFGGPYKRESSIGNPLDNTAALTNGPLSYKQPAPPSVPKGGGAGRSSRIGGGHP